MDKRDRLIIALAALVRAERETREALEAAIGADVSREVLKAIVADPVPVVTAHDLEAAERLVQAAGASYPRAA